MRHLSAGLRSDLIGTGGKISNLDPGRVRTEFEVARRGNDAENAKEVYEGTQPFEPETIPLDDHSAGARQAQPRRCPAHLPGSGPADPGQDLWYERTAPDLGRLPAWQRSVGKREGPRSFMK